VFTGDRYSSEVNFICDPTEQDGWPVNTASEGCHKKFEWRTAHICKQCTSNAVKFIEEVCKEGSKKVIAVPQEQCVINTDETGLNAKIFDPMGLYGA
jgi:hypothetical protein